VETLCSNQVTDIHITDTLSSSLALKRKRSTLEERNISMTDRRPSKKGKSVAKVGDDEEEAEQIEVCSDDSTEDGDMIVIPQEHRDGSPSSEDEQDY
jgi:hypothetical protein